MELELIKPREAIKILNCHPNTLANLEKRGELIPLRDYRNFRLFQKDEVLKVKDARDTLKKGGKKNV